MSDPKAKRLNHKTSRGKVRRWREHKLQAQATARAMLVADAQDHKYRAERIFECANRLDFAKDKAGLKLSSAFRCKARLCPVCDASKARRDYAILAARVIEHAQAHPRSMPVMLTLTVPNVAADDLPPAVTHLLESYRRFWRMPVVQRAVLGWHRSLEITFNAPKEAHPHLHVLLFVHPGYFKASSPIYLTQKSWCDLWSKATGFEHTIVHVKRVGQDRKGKLVLAPDGLFELTKYLVKPSGFYTKHDDGTWSVDPEPIDQLHKAVHKRRLRDVGGTMRKIRTGDIVQKFKDARLEDAHTELETYLFGDWVDVVGEIHGPDYWARAPPTEAISPISTPPKPTKGKLS